MPSQKCCIDCVGGTLEESDAENTPVSQSKQDTGTSSVEVLHKLHGWHTR